MAESLEADSAAPSSVDYTQVRVWSSESLMNELQLSAIGPSLELKSDTELIDQLLPPGPVDNETEPDHIEHCESISDFFTLPRHILVVYMYGMLIAMVMLFVDVLNLGHGLLRNRRLFGPVMICLVALVSYTITAAPGCFPREILYSMSRRSMI